MSQLKNSNNKDPEALPISNTTAFHAGKSKNTKDWFAAGGVTRHISENLKPSNPKLFTSKYANLIDQTDIEWFAKVRGKNLNNEDQKASGSEKASNEEESKKAKTCLFNYEPIDCPITNCDGIFIPNDMILHYLGFHCDSKEAPIKQLFEKQRLIMTIKPYELISEQIICLGLISYGGKEGESHHLAKLKACVMQNISLQKEFGHLKDDFPVFVLASVVSMEDFFKRTETFDPKFKDFSAVIIWLAGSSIRTPLACTITAYDDLTKLHSRSIIVGVRSLYESQNPRFIFNSGNGYFRMFIKQLPAFVDNEKNLKVEIVFHEDFN